MKILLQNVKHLTLRHISNGINIFQKTKKKEKKNEQREQNMIC